MLAVNYGNLSKDSQIISPTQDDAYDKLKAMTLSPQSAKSFQNFIYRFYSLHGRHDLPWRTHPTMYTVLVSEIMLQQTQVDRVIPKFRSFIKHFPSFKTLAEAPLATVLVEWQGLGYNRRAKFLHLAAKKITDQFQGKLPSDTTSLATLPGIGPYTIAAIQAFAFNQPTVVIETNIRTVYLHHFFPSTEKVNDVVLQPLIEQTLDHTQPAQWYSALMDYGTYLKSVLPNPTRRSAHYARQAPFVGSRRQVRGQILKALTLKDQLTKSQLLDTITGDTTKFDEALEQLQSEQLIVKQKNRFTLYV